MKVCEKCGWKLPSHIRIKPIESSPRITIYVEIECPVCGARYGQIGDIGGEKK